MILEIKDTAGEDNIDEICKILWSFSILGYKNEKLIEFISEYLDRNIDKLEISYLLDMFISYTNLYPDNPEVANLLVKVYKYIYIYYTGNRK